MSLLITQAIRISYNNTICVGTHLQSCRIPSPLGKPLSPLLYITDTILLCIIGGIKEKVIKWPPAN